MTSQFITHIQSVTEPFKSIDVLINQDDFINQGWEFLQQQVTEAMQAYDLTGDMTIWAEEC